MSNLQTHLNFSEFQLNQFLSHTKHLQDYRSIIAHMFIKRGNGIEVGAMHYPVALPKHLKIKYVDHLSRQDAIATYSDIPENFDKFVEVDIIDNGETLKSIENESLDFIIANHMLEHCEDPIGTIEVFLSKLRKNGIIFLAVPLMPYTFDQNRALTTFEHMLNDYETEEGTIDNTAHYLEVAEKTDKLVGGNQINKKAEEWRNSKKNIHCHTFTIESYFDFLDRLKTQLKFPIDLMFYAQNKQIQIEVVSILRKM